jgi:hypothetical protein
MSTSPNNDAAFNIFFKAWSTDYHPWLAVAIALFGLCITSAVAFGQSCPTGGALAPTNSGTQRSLRSYGLASVVDGIDYPDWFADPKIFLADRDYLVRQFNRREWLEFRDRLNSAAEPAITTRDGRVLRLQPLLDMLAAVGAALDPNASQVNSGNRRVGVTIKPRDGYKEDTPSGEETAGNPEIEIIDKEMRWYRQRKYAIPPTMLDSGSTWIATSQYGGMYRIALKSPSQITITPIAPNNNDSFFADQAPSPDEIAMGALVGQPTGAWTAFANDQDHPNVETSRCGAVLVVRLYYSVPPPPSSSVFLRQSITRLNFGDDPPSMTAIYDFWFNTAPEKLVRYTLASEAQSATQKPQQNERYSVHESEPTPHVDH